MRSWKKVSLAILLVLPSWGFGHSGGLNKEGCHTNRKTGDYHCHRGSRPQQAPLTRQSFAPSQLTPQQRATRAFRNCAEARAAGAAPVRRGDPGYGSHLDRDNDGVGCEPYKGRP